MPGPGSNHGTRGEIEKSKNFGKAITRLIKELKLFRVAIIVAIILASAGSIIAIIIPNEVSNIVNAISDGLTGAMDYDKIIKLAVFVAILQSTSAIFEIIEGFIMTDVSNKFARFLRNRIINKVNKLPLKFFDDNQTGDTMSRITNDIDSIAQSLTESLSTLVAAVTLLRGVIFMMFVTNWIMALTAVVSGVIGFAFSSIILKKSQKYFTARQRELGKINSHIEEVYSGLDVIRAYNGKAEVGKEFNRLNQRVYDANRKSQFLSGLMPPAMHFVGNLGYVAVCVVGAMLTTHDIISFGTIVAFIIYVRMFTSPLSQIAQSLSYLQLSAAASERVFEFLDETELPSQKGQKMWLLRDQVKGYIEFKDVKFGYNKDKLIIKDFSAKATPGQKIAIVGPTGAGKTTMVNLLMKFYDINSGDILIDGVSIHDLKRENIHELFTMVLQDTWLFAGTIKQNIVYNRKNVSDEKIDDVLKKVGLTHFIGTLPKGINTEIHDNDSVSAGQRQLLTIARSMIEDSPFLILDEATSNVDTRTEELVQKAMDKLSRGRTSFIIAHRLSTIKNADLILVMKDGNVVETGTHDELLQKKGFYAELYNSQFQH